MLLGARQAGFEIVGNFEWRKYYHKKDAEGRNTFTMNFPKAFFTEQYPQDHPEWLEECRNIDIIFGHGECGHASALNFSNKNYKTQQSGTSDIPKLVKAVAVIKPRFFALDNLPASCNGMPLSEYHRLLPDYDIFPEWVSNYHYGNTQLNRKRMFMVGALKTEKFAFVPGEFAHSITIKDVIGDIYGKDGKGIPNHEKHVLDDPCGKISDFYEYGYRGTWRDFQKVMSERPEGPPLPYISKDGTPRVRMGTAKVRWNGHAFVLDGGSVCTHPLRNLPLSIRERARIQGFPDNFLFYGTRLDKKGQWSHDKNNDMVKETGKAMPIQFNKYVAEQVRVHIEGKKFKSSNERMIDPNERITTEKKWYCEQVGYSNQKGACAACWMREYCTLPRYAGPKHAPLDWLTKAPVKRIPRVKAVKEYAVPLGAVFEEFSSDKKP
jgi:DNA (cytosine-5)-methyltransferase 1